MKADALNLSLGVLLKHVIPTCASCIIYQNLRLGTEFANVQVETDLLYDTFAWSMAGLQLQVTGASAADDSGTSSKAPVLYPLPLEGSLRMAKLPDDFVPMARVAASLGPLEISLNREQAEVLRALAAALQDGSTPSKPSSAANPAPPQAPAPLYAKAALCNAA